jgi:hypothetical protein
MACSSDIVLMELKAHHAVAMENATYSAASVLVDADNVPPEAAATAATLKRHLATILKAKALKINKFLSIFSLSLIPTKMGKSMEKKLNQEITPQWRTYE